MRKIILSLAVCCIMLCSGCGTIKPYASLKPVDKAVVSVEAFSSWYYNTHKELEARWAVADDEEKEILIPINEKMNKLRPLIIKYDKLVLLWQETNTQPEGITGLVEEIQRLMLGVIQALK